MIMKRFWGFLLFLAISLLFSAALADEEISEAVFPDRGFRRYILDAGFDENGDGRLSKAEIAKVTCMDCHSRNIKSLEGIEIFTELIELQCPYNRLTEVDVSKNRKLTSLGVYSNKLTKLDLSQSKNLVSFSCSANPVSEVILPDTEALTWVDISSTNLKELDIGKYPILTDLVRSGEPTPYIYAQTEEQINWVSDTSFLAINRQFTLKANGTVLYAGIDTPDPTAETPDTAKAPEVPAKKAEKQDKAETAANTVGKQKQQIARLLKPTFDGGYNTIWMSVPENYSLTIFDNDTPGYNISDEFREFAVDVQLENNRGKETVFIQIGIVTSGRWMEYGNLNGMPDDILKETEAYHVGEYTDETIDVSVYEFPSGLKVLQHLSDLNFQLGKHFIGWMVLDGYEITVRCWIDHHRSDMLWTGPQLEEIQMIDMVLNSLEIIED